MPQDPVAAAKGAYKHFMLKEIIEQPECVLDTFRGRDKMRSNIEQVRARDGMVIALVNEGDSEMAKKPTTSSRYRRHRRCCYRCSY